MKTSFGTILKNAWIYGVIFGVLSIIMNLLIYIFDVNMFSISFGILSFLVFLIAIPATFVILGTNNLRAKYALNREISYMDAVLTGLVILIIGFLISNLYSYVFNHYLDPEYMKAQMQKLVEVLEKYNLPQEKIDETMAKTEKRMGLASGLMTSGIVAVVLSLLVSLFTRKRDKVEDKMV
jgi:hypothetical protein